MRHRQLPPDLQNRVHCFVQYKWLATRGVNEESILHSLPSDLRREIQRHLCLGLVRRVCSKSYILQRFKSILDLVWRIYTHSSCAFDWLLLAVY